MVLEELLLELACWETPLVPPLVAPYQMDLAGSVEVRALVGAEDLVDLPACWIPSDPLLVLLQLLETS